MGSRNPFSLKSHLYILVHSGSGTPYSGRLQLQKLSSYLTVGVSAFVVTTIGTLLFFRELELNRKLQDQILELQTREQLGQSVVDPVRNLTAAVPTSAPPTDELPASDSMPTMPVEARPASAPSAARIGELTAECTNQDCNVKLSMITTAPGAVQGQLLIVLETEIPRIGTGNPTTQLRRRFFLYPGNVAKDELTQSGLLSLERKPFRFSRVLQTTAAFNFGKLLRPLAVNAYVFDENKGLVQHERKAIDSDISQE